ncbi:MAG: hypothetical protein REI12_14490 [Pedobacter sp.]|nr:hypothetical protein [Pedobacter sp.]
MKLAKRFLLLYAFAHIAGGLLLPCLVDTPFFAHYNNAVATAFNTQDAASRAQANYLSALMGPTVASWGLLFALAVQQSFAKPTRMAWWGMLGAGLLWAPYDSWPAWQHGVHLNTLINVLSLLALLVPLWLVRHNFLHAPHNTSS